MLCDYFYETLFLPYLQFFVLYVDEAHKLGELLKLPLLLEACGADASGEQCQYGDRARHLHGFGRNRENELKLRLALVFPPADSANLHSSFWERFHLLHIEHQN